MQTIDAPSDLAGSEELPALEVSAELWSCKVADSAWVLHRWLRERCAHDAIAVTVSGCGAALSQWAGPAFAFPAGLDWSSATTVDYLGRRVIAISGDGAASGVTIHVAIPGHDEMCSRLEGELVALARVLAARVGGAPSASDTARLSLAHAVCSERERVTRELTDHFAQYLHTIVHRLRDASEDDVRARVHSATSAASRALVDLRVGRRPVWRQARRVDEAFVTLESDLGELARAAGIQLERALIGEAPQTLPNAVIDAACWITRAAMLNVVEHSGAARARIGWRLTTDELLLAIVDDGSGFDPQRASRGGLSAMRRTAEGLGGSLELESTPGWGTRIDVRLPVHVDTSVPADESANALIGTLRDRELAVLRLLAVGHRNREIASELFLSQHTVKFHVANIFEKLGVRTRAEAAALAFAAGLHPTTSQTAIAAAA
jgi:signal transduction histidine kinase/DNA-binding CsgD family transcriptional regulator